MDHDVNPFMFTNPWPTLPELVPNNNTDILFKYLASYHAVSTGQQQTQANTAAKDTIYPWMRETSNMNAAMKRSPFHLQTGGLTLVTSQPNNQHYGAGGGLNQLMSSSESLASPISPQPTPPISLSPGTNEKFAFSLAKVCGRN